MPSHTKRLDNLRGATLVESMLALMLLAGLGTAVFPLFTLSRKTLKQSSIGSECQRLVEAKIAQYRQGIAADLTTGSPDFASRTSSSRTMRQGFAYAASRYTAAYASGICSATGVVASGLWAGRPFGIRECLEGGTPNTPPAFWTDGTPAPVCTSAIDQMASTRLPGFALYVRLIRVTPWAPTSGTLMATPDRDSVDCPLNYDFRGAQDGIQVTVTAVLDANANLALPKNARQCQATTILEPSRPPVRFMLKQDGRIYDASGMGANGSASVDATDSDWLFPALYTDVSATRGLPIRAFSVHPMNRSVWILKPGVLLRYSDCTGLNCSTTVSTNGISDAGLLRGSFPSIQEFEVSDSIQSIAVDYQRGAVYGITSAQHNQEGAPAGRGIYRIVRAGTTQNISAITSGSPVATDLMTLSAEGYGYDPSRAPFFLDDQLPDRTLSMFTNPAADTAFVVARFTAISRTPNIEMTGIYSGADRNLLLPIIAFPDRAIAFSP